MFFVAIMAIYMIATEAGLSEWLVALLELGLALALVGFVFARMGDEVGEVVRNRDLMLIYTAGIAILWNLWFFSFWSVSIVADATKGGFWQSALTATFFGVAGIIGFPLGGWLGDREKRSGRGRKPMLVAFTLIQGLLTVGFGLYLQRRRERGLGARRAAVRLQPVLQRAAADLARARRRPRAEGRADRRGVRDDEPDRRDGRRAVSGDQRRAARRDRRLDRRPCCSTAA